MKKLFFAPVLTGALFLLCLAACKELDAVKISLTVNPLGGTAPLDVTARCEVLSGELIEYIWDFGDGKTEQGAPEVFHRYTKPGTYTLSLTAIGLEGKERKPEKVTLFEQRTITVNVPDSPPTASFIVSPNAIIADQTNVSFNNTSTGTVSSWQWQFGNQEGSSTQKSPSYRFDFAGVKTIKLTASGPLGKSMVSKTITVHAMDPASHNYSSSATHSESAIQALRNSGQVKIGATVFQNNYSGSVKVEFFHPTNWLNGGYLPFGNVYWRVNGSVTNTLLYNNVNFNIGSDWGVRVSFTNGVVSCVRTLSDVATYGSGKWTIKATRVYEGN